MADAQGIGQLRDTDEGWIRCTHGVGPILRAGSNKVKQVKEKSKKVVDDLCETIYNGDTNQYTMTKLKVYFATNIAPDHYASAVVVAEDPKHAAELLSEELEGDLDIEVKIKPSQMVELETDVAHANVLVAE